MSNSPEIDRVEMTRAKTLDLAKQYILHDRNVDNGDPEDNFSDIAALWNWYAERRWPGRDVEFTPLDVALMSSDIKKARQLSNPYKWDNYIDMAGYSACAAEVAAIQKHREETAKKETKLSELIEEEAKKIADSVNELRESSLQKTKVTMQAEEDERLAVLREIEDALK